MAQLRPEGRGVALVAVGGGSAIDAAKGIALAAVNPHRGRRLDYRSDFPERALPIVAVPTMGAPERKRTRSASLPMSSHRKFYVEQASTLPAGAILDPELTIGLPPAVTAATGMDALTHALESYLSIRANPWSDGIALQVIRMIAVHLPRACAGGTDLEARSQMLLAAHMAGIGMASTGLGACHAIGHALGGRLDIAHGVALTMVLPHLLRFSLRACEDRIADISAALGADDSGRPPEWNAGAAIDAIAGLAARVGITSKPADFGITAADFAQIAADALDDEVLANAPCPPTAMDIHAILLAGGNA